MQPSAPAPYQAEGDVGGFVSTWIKIWAGLLAVVTLVVVLFLIFITQTLASINGNLATARDAVVNIGGETKTLPRQVDNINTSLRGIAPAVAPIYPKAVQIRDSLASINAKLANVDSSVIDTSGSLRSSLGLVGQTRGVLINADNPPDRLGVQNIHQRVKFANGTGPGTTGPFGTNPVPLSDVRGDTIAVVRSLDDTNAHLDSACAGLTIGVNFGGIIIPGLSGGC